MIVLVLHPNPLLASQTAGEAIRRIRREQRRSQAEVADMARIPRATLARLESGSGDPRVDTVIAALEALGHTLEFGPELAEPRIDPT